MADISKMQIAAAVLDLVPHMDEKVVTLRVIIDMLATRFNVDFATMRKHKDVIKELVMQRMEREEQPADASSSTRVTQEDRTAKRRSNVISDESDDADADYDKRMPKEESGSASQTDSNDDDDSDSDATKKRKRSSSSTVVQPAKRKATASKKATVALKKPRPSPDAPGLTALKELARAARLLSPRVYAALKKLASEHEQEEHVRELLQANDVRFSGQYPQKREIDAVRKKKDFEKDMEGIDTSLIIEDTSSRPRRAARGSQVSYAEQLLNQVSSDEEGDRDVAAAKRQRARWPRANKSEEEEEGGDASNSSEAEF